MGMCGRLTRNQFGFSMPVIAPLYQKPPFYFQDVRMASFRFETGGEEAADLLPAPLELADPPTAVLAIADYPWSTFGPYREAFLTVDCVYRGRPLRFLPWILVTTEPPLAAGREIWGIPKKLGQVDFVWENDLFAGYAERPRGLRLASGVMRPERPVDLQTFRVIPPVFLRVIPSPEEGSPPSVAELVEIGIDQRPKAIWEGPGSCHFPGGSDLDPWHRLPVKRMVNCGMAVYNMELKYGKILERF